MSDERTDERESSMSVLSFLIPDSDLISGNAAVAANVMCVCSRSDICVFAEIRAYSLGRTCFNCDLGNLVWAGLD